MIFIILLFLIGFIFWCFLKTATEYDNLINFELNKKNKSGVTKVNK